MKLAAYVAFILFWKTVKLVRNICYMFNYGDPKFFRRIGPIVFLLAHHVEA